MLNWTVFSAVFAALFSWTSVFAATLNAVPMQGGMVMPMISYHSQEGRLRVMLDPTVPQLTPLALSNPGDGFQPGDPWFEALDPSGEGRSFSRRYGFVMDAMTEMLPGGTAIWLRMISSSPGLSVHRYSNSEPKAFEPIFGTAGTTNALHWNGMMFHPVFSAPPGTTAHTATFEAFLVDTATGQPVPDSSTGPMVFNWTNSGEARPELLIEHRIVIPWPANATNYVLEGTASIPNVPWSVVTNQPVVIDGRSAVVIDKSDSRKFFRMKLVE
jgi:hypothetical protein